MRIIVDADAMPSIPAIESFAQEYQVPCLLICDDTHQLQSDFSEVIVVSKGYQSVDMYLIGILKEGDIVITQDYGVATLALLKKTKVVHPKGMIYTEENILELLESRHQNQKLRKQKRHIIGPKKRTLLDEQRLLQSLRTCIEHH